MVVGIGVKTKPLDQVRESVPVRDAAKGEVVRLNLNIDKQLRADWKRAAIDLDTDVTTMVHDAMKEYLLKYWKV